MTISWASVVVLLASLGTPAWGSEPSDSQPEPPPESQAEPAPREPDRGSPETSEGSERARAPRDSKAAKEGAVPVPGSYNPRTDRRDRTPEVDSPLPKLQKRKTGRRPYPRRLFDDWSLPRTCDVRVVLNARGKPQEVLPDGCLDPDLFAHTARWVRRDRWRKPTPEGAVVPVRVTFTPPVDEIELATSITWRRRYRTVCKVHLAIQPEGGFEAVRSEGDCELPSGDLPAIDERHLRRKKGPSVCGLTFVTREGEASQLERFRCPLHLWAPTRAVLEALTWPDAPDHPGGVQPWSALLQFNHPGRE